MWGQHWAVRTVASLVSTMGSCILAGLVARRRGGFVAAIATTPTVLAWASIAVFGWVGQVTLGHRIIDFSTVSLGNKLAAAVVAIGTWPLAVWAGRYGQGLAQELAPHFDSRRRSLLGVKWFHYFWLPPLVHLWLAQGAWASFYTVIWMRMFIRVARDQNLFAGIIPLIFAGMFYGSLWMMGNGAARAYAILAAFESEEPRRSALARAGGVLKYGVGALVLAGAVQVGAAYLQDRFASLLGAGETP